MEFSLRNKSFFIDGAKFLSIIWSVLFFFQSNSIYYVAYESNFKKYIYALSVVLSIGSLFLILLYSLGHLDFFVRTFLSINFFALICLVFYWGSLTIGNPISIVDVYTYWVLLAIFFLWNCFLKSINIENYLFIFFRKIVTVYSIISIVMWIICSILPIVGNYSQLMVIWGSIHSVPLYFHLYTQSQDPIVFLGINFVRNTGIFAEAPMYSFVLSVALLINVFIEKKFNAVTIILILTIFTTGSTTGVLISILILAILFSRRLIRSKYKKVFLPLIVFIILLGVLISIIVTVLKFQQGSGSVSVRLDDFRAGYITWTEHPFFGSGLSNNMAIIKNMNTARWFYVGHIGNTGFSSGFMEYLAGGGLFFLIFYCIYPILGSTIIFSKDKNSKFLFSIGIFFLILISLINNLFLFIFLLSWMWSIILFNHRVEG